MLRMSLRALNRWMLAAAVAASTVACGGAQKPPPDPDLVADPVASDEAGIEKGAAQNDYQRALAYIDKQQWDKANELLTKVLETSPDNADAHTYLGLVLEKKNDPAGAEKSYLAALALKPGHVMAAVNASGMYLTAKPPRVDEALKILDKAVAAVPDDPALLQNLGHARAAKGDVAGSAKAFQSAIAKGDSLDLRLALANVYFDAKQFEQAVPHAKKVLEMNKDNVKVFANVGFMFEYGKAFTECVTAFDRALKLKADEPDWFLRRGRCKHELGNDDAALEDYSASVRVKPDFAAGHLYMGMVQHQQQKLQSAEASFKKAIELGKDTPVGKLAAKKLRELQTGKP
ncbi:MAG TPA: tetratricopeptide repeat protein [Polyangium sp.]|nr:tetratricopeptide repeat protein [Polyangium sp.]